MPTLISGRELASVITINGKNKELTYIGSGTTCLVYRTEDGDVVKEFAPLIGNTSVLKRKNGRNSELTELETLSDSDRDIVAERRRAFSQEGSIANEICARYRDLNDNMFLAPEFKPDTSLGKVQLCSYAGGVTLETRFGQLRDCDSFQEKFLSVLPHIISLYDEIAFYHEKAGFLNLDIKPENLFCLQSQGRYIDTGVRNLDFGSIKRIHDKKDEQGNVIEQGLISAIRCYAENHNELSKDILCDRIAAKFIASSPSFYDEERVKSIICTCIDSQDKSDEIASDLMNLDCLAAWKTFLYGLINDSMDWLLDKVDSRFLTERQKVPEMFRRIFVKHQLTSHNSLFESYNIYFNLYKIEGRMFGKPQYRLTAAQIADRLRNILCILNGVPENRKNPAQRNFEVMNAIYCKKDALLHQHGLKSIKDILEFCKQNELSVPEPIESLHWYLLFGERHPEQT